MQERLVQQNQTAFSSLRAITESYWRNELRLKRKNLGNSLSNNSQ